MELPQNTLASSVVFLTILRGFFQHSIGRQMPQWAWDPNELSSKIIIELAHNYKLEGVQLRPAIYVQRGTFTTRRSVFGDVARPEWVYHKEQEEVDKKTLYSKEIYGTINLNVYSLEGGEAEAIANLVFECFVTQEQLLEREFKYKWLGDVSLGPVGAVEEDKSVFIVPVTISPIVYDYAWSNQTRAPLLKRLGLESTDVDKLIQSSVYKEFFPKP